MSGSIDSLYPQPPATNAPPNLVGTAGPILDMVGKLNANTQFQQQQAAMHQYGQILQNAIDPNTGAMDFGKAAVGIVTNPATALFAPELIGKIASNNQTALGNISKALENAHTQMNGANELLTGLLPKVKDQTLNETDVAGAVAKGIGTGLFSPDFGQNFIKNMPPSNGAALGKPGTNPLADNIKGIIQQNQNGRDATNQVFGSGVLAQTGGQIVPSVVPNAFNSGGAKPGGQPIAMTPTPDALNATKTVTDDTGAQTLAAAKDTQNFYDGAGNLISSGGKLQVSPSVASSYIGGKYQTELGDRVRQAPIQVDLLQKNLDLLKSFNPGAGAPVFTDIAAKLKALGVSDDAISAMAGKPDPIAAAQVFAKNGFLSSMHTLGALVGQNNITDQKAQEILNVLPSIGTNPNASKAILQYLQHIGNLPILEQKAFGQYLDLNKQNSQKYPLSAWPQVYADKLQKSKYLTNIPQLAGESNGPK